jgi:hypothetical protein
MLRNEAIRGIKKRRPCSVQERYGWERGIEPRLWAGRERRRCLRLTDIVAGVPNPAKRDLRPGLNLTCGRDVKGEVFEVD